MVARRCLQIPVAAGVYFWIVYSIPLVYVPFLCQYHAVLYNFKSGIIHPVLLFLLRIALTIRYLFKCFHMNLSFLFLWKWHWNVYGDCIECINCFLLYIHFHNNNSAYSWTWEIFTYYNVFFSFFLQCFVVSIVEVFHLLCFSFSLFLSLPVHYGYMEKLLIFVHWFCILLLC
jgi:hypothetical protein